MSVLSVPRIFFQGKVSWNPATGNNNDAWPVYDFPNAVLNWDYLQSPGIGITPENVREKFPEWARTPRWCNTDPTDPLVGYWMPPGEWNYYGGMEWSLHTDSEHTAISGGQLAHGGEVITDDSLVGAVLDLVGDTFPGSTFNTPGRFVDNNPDSYWCSNFYLRRFQLGTRQAPEHYLSGEIDPGTYLTTRWLNFARNLNDGNQLTGSGVAGVLLQGCLPKGDTLVINRESSSTLLRQLADAVEAPGVKGLMIRLSAYTTMPFRGPEYACMDQISDPNQRQSARYRKLSELWEQELSDSLTPSDNPAVSTVVGTIGLWQDDDPLSSAPGGRYLVATNPFTRGTGPTASKVYLGPAAAEVQESNGPAVVSLDLSNTIPEIDAGGEKQDLGLLQLKLVQGSNSVTLAEIKPEQYAQQAYEATSGLLDVQIAAPTAAALAQGSLELHYAPSLGKSVALLTERVISINTDERSVYLDQGESSTVTVQVRERGAIPERPVELRVQQYVPWPLPPGAAAAYLQLPPNPSDECITLDQTTITVPPGTGEVTVGFTALRPGSPVIAFFDRKLYPGQLPATISYPPTANGESIVTASYACVRVLPFDDDLPQAFIDDWEANQRSHTAAWNFVYRQVFCLYDALYPVMRYYGSLDLGDQESVDRNIDFIVGLCQPEMQHSTLYMPVSRELSAGKRRVIELYQQIVRAVRGGSGLDTLELLP